MPRMRAGDLTFSFRRTGQGPPLILLHSSSSHGGQWKPLAEQAAGRFETLAPDFAGYGNSGSLPGGEVPFFEQDTRIVHALLDTLDEPAHIAGHSLGAAIAVRAALQRPGSVASLILFEPVLFNLLQETGDDRRFEYLELAHAMMVLIRYGNNEKAAALFLDFWIGPGALDALETDTRGYVIRTIPRLSDDLCGISIHAPHAIGVADLGRLDMPALVMCGEHTRPSARGIAEILRDNIPGAEYVEMPGLGHMAPITNPQEVNRVMIDFLDRHAG